MDELKQTEAEVVLGEQQVGAYTVRPWTIGKLAKLSPAIERLTAEFGRRGIKGFAEFEKNFQQIIFSVLPELPNIFSVTLDIDLEKAEAIAMDESAALAIAIVRQNLLYLKNSLSPALALLAGLTEAVKKE
jgi:hypothetical protein